MQPDQIGFGDEGIALVSAAVGRAVAEEVLGGRDDMILIEEGETRTFQSLHDGGGILGRDLRIFRVTFICAAPAVVASNCNRQRERPVHAGRAYLGGSDLADAADQVPVVRRA